MPVRRYSPLSVFLLVARRGDADESDSTVNGLQTGLAVWPEAHGREFRTKLHEAQWALLRVGRLILVR